MDLLIHFAELQDLLPGIINQLGPDNLVNLKKIAEAYSAQKKEESKDGKEEDVPELVEDFEQASKKQEQKGEEKK
jgi:nascent polypeptide-associated complex subunit beta